MMDQLETRGNPQYRFETLNNCIKISFRATSYEQHEIDVPTSPSTGNTWEPKL